MKLKILFSLLIFTTSLFAQNDWRIAKNTSSLDLVERIDMPLQDNDQLLEEELERRGPGIAPRFAVTFPVNITPDSHGTWDYTPSGKAVWRLKIHSKDAKSLNLGFTKYIMPPGGMLVIYSADQRMIHGPYTPADNEEHEQLWTPVFPSDEMIVEVQVPAENKSLLQLELKSINHDFLGFGAVVSGSCNVDVLCGIDDGFPEIENHRDIIQSVAVYGLNGGTFCTGFLINNARNDCTPYFMTADHCGINSGNAASIVAYWNYQNSTCRTPGSTQSGQNGNGQLNDSNSGAIFRSGLATSDFTLVELDDPVSETAEGFMAGWNRGSTPPSSSICVHHPNTEEKRISFENAASIMTNGFGNNSSANFTHVRVVDWDLGTTEPGSSGSPLFDQDERVVGQLHGGGAACGNNQSDWYGAFARSWTGGGSSSNRLSDWLDPDGTGIMELDGIEASFCSFGIEPIQSTVEACPTNNAVFTLVATPNFVADVDLTVSGVPAGASSSWSANPVSPGDTTYLTITGISNLVSDDYILNVNATDMTNTALEVLVLSVIETPPNPVLTAPVNGASNISISPTSLFWNAVPFSDNYFVEVATDMAFTNIVHQVTTTAIVNNPNTLSNGVTYYWKVTANNSCGQTTSNIFSFTTALDLSVSVNPGTIVACDTETVTFSLSIGSDFSASGANLSASNLPAGATINYSQNPAIPGTPVTVTIDNLDGTPAGNYTASITVDDGQYMSTKNITLIINAAPLPAGMNVPVDGEVEVELTPQFLWLPSDDANTYTLEIATDANFTNVVEGTSTNITVYTVPTDLDASTTYFWRVIANGDCGMTPSAVRTFTTIIIDDVGELNNTKVDIRPNPTTGIVNIALSDALPGELTVEVFAINGQQLIRQIKTGETNIEVSLGEYPSGVYLLKLVNAQNVLSRRIIVQK